MHLRNQSSWKTKKISLVFFLFLLSILISSEFRNSVFLKGKERINVVLYDETPKYLSFSSSGINYLVEVSPNSKVLVPGGYGLYRVGGLGKLASLEKDPFLIKKTFSGASASFVDLYFYSPGEIYYFDKDKSSKIDILKLVAFSPSNANLIDRMALFFSLLGKDYSDFKVIKIKWEIFVQEKFNKKYQGVFYKKSYRERLPSVQIIYHQSFSTANLLGQILVGEGIRVVDLTKDKQELISSRCRVIAKKNDFIAKDIAEYFNCRLEKGSPPISDIIFQLGSLETQWAVR
ncbi:MAG: hypothetical protein NZL96_02365 [Patescibacteria group bacterium]|nr:hypothetical protein [Patescibacteria group bacterium]